MTDSMKFGPEWLRNMATDMTNNQGSAGGGGGGGGGGSSSTSSASSTNSNNNGSSNSYQFGQQQHLQQQQQQQVPQLQVRGLFPEFRYGREEMLSLFNKNCSMPEILPSFKKLFVDKVQYPLALTPSTEEEVFSSVAPPPTQRPQWLQRSPVAFNSAPRGTGRGGSVDRGRMRGKSMYHPIFTRPTQLFEDEARNPKPERGWSERNGVAGESSAVGTSEWNISPSSSPRKDFTGHPVRNLENWRRSRHDEDGVATGGPPGGGNANSGLSGGGNSGGVGAGGDGWRGSGSNNFGNNRWGRSTSWRDDDGGNGTAVEANVYNIPPMQRSYSTIATTERTYFSCLSKSSSLTSATASGVGSGGGNSDGTNKSNVPGGNSRHHHPNSANHQWEMEDMPEWAMENPTDSGGTFDATGAFHGSVDEDDEKRRGGGSGSSSTTSSSSVSNRKKPKESTSEQDGKNSGGHRVNRKIVPKVDGKLPIEQDSRVSLNDEDSKSTEVEQRTFKEDNPQVNISAENSIQSNEEISSINKLETSEEHLSDSPSINSSSPAQLTTQNTSTPNSATATTAMMQSSHKTPVTELSDRMQEDADDMVEKLIMDDDNVAQNSQKPSATAAINSVTPLAAVVTGKLPTNVASLPSATMASNAAMYKNQPLANKPMFLPEIPIIQHHHLQHASVAAAAAVSASAVGAPPPGTRMLPPPLTKPGSNELWYYRDPQSKVQGPFTAMEMIEWYRAGYFDENLYVRRVCDKRFAALGELIKMCGQMPFQSSHLIPPLLSAEIPSMTNSIPIMPLPPHDSGHQMKDAAGVGIVNGTNIGINDLKVSVTATADALSAAVKNIMNPADMSHILNAHFQMLQEQYIRHQEIRILADFSTKETFNQLTPTEKAAVVRQKVHMIGLPEHLTSWAGLSNSLASLNPAAGNQLYEVIAECSKKDTYGISPLEAQLQQFQQHFHHQHQQQGQQQQVQHRQVQQQQVQQQSQNPFLEPDDFLQQQQQLQANQQSGMYQNAPYRSAFPQMDATGSTAPSEEQLSVEILNELNLRMMLRQGRLRTGREQTPLPPQLGATPNDFGADLLARPAPQVLNAAMVGMLPQWPPHMLPHGQIPQPPQQQQPPPPMQQNTQIPPVAPNQWQMIPGPVAVPQLPAAVGKPPGPMWVTADSGAQLILQHQQQPPPQLQQPQVDAMHPKVENNFVSVQLQPQPQPQQQQQLQHRQQDVISNNIAKTNELVEEDNAINNNASVLSTSNTITAPDVTVVQTTYSNNNKNKNEKLKPNEDNQTSLHITNKQQSIATILGSANNNNNKRNGKQKPNEKPIDSSKNKPQQQQIQPVAGPTEEERRKEAAEEKRKQKEEKKRQQLEEEKKRLQLVEDEKRRQASEEKERQKEIHAHRRKAMLSSNSGGSTAALGSSSFIAANGKSTVSGPGSTMSKQERMQTSIAPWSNNAHATTVFTPGPSLAEIQKAERRERRADQQRLTELMEKQTAAAAEASDNVLKWNAAPVAVKSLAAIQAEESKRLASEHAANAELQRRKDQEQSTSAAANSLSSNPFAMIWSGSKVWGATNSTSGFWDESVKFPSATAGISCPTPAAAAIAKAVGQTSGNSGSQSSVTSKQSVSTPFASGGGNTSSSAAVSGGGGNRNLSKSQTGSNLANFSNWTVASNMSSNSNQSKSQQQTTSVKQQGNNTNATLSSAVAAAAVTGGSRNLSKSQTGSNIANYSNWTVAANMSNNSSQSKAQQQNSVLKQQGNNINETNKGKKGNKNLTGSSSSTNCLSSNSLSTTSVANNHVNKNDDHRNEFTGWCMKSLNNMSPKVDVPTFVTFLQDCESPYEVKDYIRMYLGESKEYTEFAKQFLERRSKYKNLQRAQNAHIDDMCKPAPAINPSGNDSFDNKGKQKKVKKSKMTKLDARILGFSVTAAEGRINVGDRDYGDAS